MLNWIPAVTTASLLMLLGWLFRAAIVNRLTKGVQHEYDQKLEILRADFRKGEEVLKAELRTKEREIESLRAGALAGLVSRQAAVDGRRLVAIDQIWSGMTALGSVRGAAALMSVINFERALKESASNPRAKEMFQSIAAPFDPAKLTTGDASKARPFVSPMAWALFSAYTAIHGLAVTQLSMLKLGLDMPDVIALEPMKKLVKTALPEYAGYIDEHGVSSFFYLIEELEKRILAELSDMMKGKDADNDSIERAAKILEASQEVSRAREEKASAEKLDGIAGIH